MDPQHDLEKCRIELSAACDAAFAAHGEMTDVNAPDLWESEDKIRRAFDALWAHKYAPVRQCI